MQERLRSSTLGEKRRENAHHLDICCRHDEGGDFYILLHCSPKSTLAQKFAPMERQMSVPAGSHHEIKVPVGSLHDLVLDCYIDNWRPYLRHIGNELEEIVKTDLQGYVRSAKLLHDRIDNTVDLISCTLTLHNQEQTGKLDNEMKALAEETSKVTRKLAVITENSANDGEIVRVVTIVSAIYLPGSFATSIFGMSFFQFGADGEIAISRDFWKFVVLWVTLTCITGAMFCVAYMRSRYGSVFLSRRRSRQGIDEKEGEV
ncbi:hypothetical protein N0V93_002431 [Gnomoniopsis smithogilvyi]|uniref:Uncharacterized protein n=1 Tax=Gnomoniopsis smithogilvyi TaxID=1191159 RepID=A0A9W9CZ23_9PEZI|nr:hypothetical protein N0V93_002431 [Gnomoniopsis smithogilvyi]